MHCAHLLGRAEQMRDYDRRTGDIAMERDTLQAAEDPMRQRAANAA